MDIQFTKYHGTGNDFIIIDQRYCDHEFSHDEVRFLCDRHFGIGADGLMLLNHHPDYDFTMTYFNSDGHESTMCGNGGRCITAYAVRSGQIHRDNIRFMAVDGLHDALIVDPNPASMRIRLKMKDTMIGHVYDDGIFLDTGSPHFVTFCNNLDQVDVFHQGRSLRYDRRFEPGGSNINFVESLSGQIKVRTYERGVENETLSCGTGVTASALALAYLEKGSRDHYHISTRGGELSVFFKHDKGQFTDVWLEGAATFVFSGTIRLQTNQIR